MLKPKRLRGYVVVVVTAAGAATFSVFCLFSLFSCLVYNLYKQPLTCIPGKEHLCHVPYEQSLLLILALPFVKFLISALKTCINHV